MSRLYCKVNSDSGDTVVTKTGHEYIYIEIYYRGKDKDQYSELCKRIMVKYTKRMKQPKIT